MAYLESVETGTSANLTDFFLAPPPTPLLPDAEAATFCSRSATCFLKSATVLDSAAEDMGPAGKLVLRMAPPLLLFSMAAIWRDLLKISSESCAFS